jgi:hypothetical protein
VAADEETRWSRLYALVLGVLALIVLGLYLFGRHYR